MPDISTIFDPDWRDDAACRDMDIAIFFPDSEDKSEAAKGVCAACLVRESCLEFALATRQDDGVWGGFTETERRRLRRRRQQGARRTAAA